MTPRDLFISHSSGDSDVARELRGVLEAAGYSCWMAPDDVDASGTWTEQILGAIDSSRAMVVLISAHANESQHVSREVNLALGRKRVVLPIRIEPVPPSGSLEYLLSLVQRIDAFPLPISGHSDQILRRLETVIRREPGAPPPKPGATPSTEIEAADLVLSEPAVTGPPLVESGVPESAIPEPAVSSAATGPLDLPVLSGNGVIGAGSRIGAFTIESLLGEGGMATVYRARQDEPKRGVALKVIRADHAADPTYRERFLAEKDTLASLEHQSIVPIYAAGEASGVLYIAMRLVDGADLTAKLIASGRLTLAETISVLEPIADAVDYAHEMGVIHRDLKPSNIILDRRGRPYLTDFGLGKRIDGSRAALSSPGVAVGTLEYMAPEQFTGLSEASLAGRIDIYALACVAFACLTGASPFQRESPERVMYAHAHESIPSLRAARPDLPASVDAVLAKALAKNPGDRFASAHEFISALTLAAASAEGQTAAIVPLKGGGSGDGRGRWLRSNRPLAGIAAAAIVALAVISGGVLAFGPGPSATPTPAGSLTAVASTATDTTEPTIGPSNEPTDGPTEPPITTPPITAPPITAPPITAPPVVDTLGPTGGAISLSGNFSKTLTTISAVSVTITKSPTDRSGICALAASTVSTVPSNASSQWVSYHGSLTTFSRNVSTSSAGVKTIYVWFRDCRQNRSTSAAHAQITFDHAPVSTGHVYDWSTDSSVRAQFCGYSQIYVIIPGFAATDPDGNSSITLLDVWQSSTHWTIDASKQFTFTNPLPTSASTYTFNFKAKDSYGVPVQGTFKVKLGPC